MSYHQLFAFSIIHKATSHVVFPRCPIHQDAATSAICKLVIGHVQHTTQDVQHLFQQKQRLINHIISTY